VLSQAHVIVLETKTTLDTAALARFARTAGRLAGLRSEVGIMISGPARIRGLNRRFRRVDKPTDVLSFPDAHGGGDIAICLSIARHNAALHGHSVLDELKVLVLHGMLHLAGYDHEADSGQMARREASLRRRLRLPASLIARAHAPAPDGRRK